MNLFSRFLHVRLIASHQFHHGSPTKIEQPPAPVPVPVPALPATAPHLLSFPAWCFGSFTDVTYHAYRIQE